MIIFLCALLFILLPWVQRLKGLQNVALLFFALSIYANHMRYYQLYVFFVCTVTLMLIKPDLEAPHPLEHPQRCAES
jgi:hypothetical protein